MSAQRIHLFPLMMTAAAALLGLKLIGFATGESYLFTGRAEAASAAKSEAPKEETKPAEPAPAAPKPAPEPPPPDVSASERALLEALQKRREIIEERSKDVDLREQLLKAAEKRVQERLDELKRLEEQVAAADARRAEEEKGKLNELVAMYEAMKVKEAARIFDDLDPAVLLQVAARMKPQRLSEIMGKMTPEAAQRLTVALARREGVNALTPKAAAAALTELPKIEGRPATP